MRAFPSSLAATALPVFSRLAGTSLWLGCQQVPMSTITMTRRYNANSSSYTNNMDRGNRSSSSSPPTSSNSWRRRFTPTRFLPRFEIHDVRDDPSQGSMTRISIDGKQLLITQYPQMGPRKLDPHDPTPQFDSSRRISTRFRHVDLGAMAAVTKGWLTSHHVRNNAYDLTFEKKTTPGNGYALHGSVHRAGRGGPQKESESWTLVLENHFAIALEHFLDAGLTESYGFHQFALAQAEHALRTAEEGTDVVKTSRNGYDRPNNRTWRQ